MRPGGAKVGFVAENCLQGLISSDCFAGLMSSGIIKKIEPTLAVYFRLGASLVTRASVRARVNRDLSVQYHDLVLPADAWDSAEAAGILLV